MNRLLGVVMITALGVPGLLGLLRAELNIPNAYRVRNDESGSCVWCCLDMMSNYHQMPTKFRTSYSGAANPNKVNDALTSRGIDFQMYYPSPNKPLDFVKLKTQNDIPVMVALWWWPHTNQGTGTWHAVIVVGVKDNLVTIIDPNTPDKTWSWSEEAFLKYWVGWAVTLKR